MSQKKEATELSEVFTIDLDLSDSGDIPGVTRLLNPAKMAEMEQEREKIKAANAGKAAASARHEANEPITLEPTRVYEKPAAEKPADKTRVQNTSQFTLEPTRTVATSTNAAPVSPASPPPILGSAAKSAQRLKDIAVMFDFHFTQQNGSFRFKNGVAHSEPFLQAWQQELLNKMKLDLKTLLFKEPFQEFRFETFGYLYAAFGVQNKHFIQVVQTGGSADTVHVLVSSQSQAAHKDVILSILQQSPETKAAIANDASGVIEIDLAS